MFEPQEFFQKLPKKIKYAEPTKFFLKIQAIVLAILIIVLAMAALFMSTLSLIGGKELSALVSGLSFGLILIILIIGFPILLLLSWAMLYLTAASIHIFVIAFKGDQGFVETYKVVAYSGAPSIFGIIPYLNWAAWIYIIVLQVMGIERRQKLSQGKSVASILLPIAITFLLGMILAFMLLALVFII